MSTLITAENYGGQYWKGEKVLYWSCNRFPEKLRSSIQLSASRYIKSYLTCATRQVEWKKTVDYSRYDPKNPFALVIHHLMRGITCSVVTYALERLKRRFRRKVNVASFKRINWTAVILFLTPVWHQFRLAFNVTFRWASRLKRGHICIAKTLDSRAT